MLIEFLLNQIYIYVTLSPLFTKIDLYVFLFQYRYLDIDLGQLYDQDLSGGLQCHTLWQCQNLESKSRDASESVNFDSLTIHLSILFQPACGWFLFNTCML